MPDHPDDLAPLSPDSPRRSILSPTVIEPPQQQPAQQSSRRHAFATVTIDMRTNQLIIVWLAWVRWISGGKRPGKAAAMERSKRSAGVPYSQRALIGMLVEQGIIDDAAQHPELAELVVEQHPELAEPIAERRAEWLAEQQQDSAVEQQSSGAAEQQSVSVAEVAEPEHPELAEPADQPAGPVIDPFADLTAEQD